MKTTSLSTLTLITMLLTLSASAQTWRWAASGGSSNNNWSADHYEYIRDIATDHNGNVYTISTIGNKGIHVAGIFNQVWVQPQFYYSREVMINSFSCDGSVRWSKLLGSRLGHDIAYSLRADSNDGIYAAINFDRSTELYIDNDTLLTSTSFKNLYLVKYDTAGNYQWFTGPQEDTISAYAAAASKWRSIEVDGQGNLYCFTRLPAGAYGGTYTAPVAGDYVLKYDRNGAFIGATKLETNTNESDLDYAHFNRDATTGRYYMAGAQWAKFYAGSDSVTHGMYVIAFDKDGNYLWKKENQYKGYSGFSYRPLIDNAGDLYLCGYGKQGDVFNGFTFAHVSPPMPFVVKMDNMGNNIWIKAATLNNFDGVGGIALRNSGEIDLITTTEYMYWPGLADTVDYPRDRPVITRFNTHTGKVLGMDTTTATFSNSNTGVAYAMAIAPGRNNSLFIGGGFGDSLTIGDTILTSTGGEDDFFITRWGYDTCGCTDIPQPSFTATFVNWNTFQFTYTGSQPTSTLVWDFGDGVTSTQLSPTHVFGGGKRYDVTVTVTNDCGDNTYGAEIQTVGINELATKQVNIYPNPATDKLTIEGAAPNSTIYLFDIGGRLHHTRVLGSGANTISTASLPAGQYLLKLSAAGDSGSLHRFVKQ